MIIFNKATELTQYIDSQLLNNKTIGFVPTMGALHQGHISLLNQCKSSTDVSIVSIFVNPTQFNNAADFAKYPNTVPQDLEHLKIANCDVVYLPTVDQLYPNGTDKLKHYNIDGLDTRLEGEFRPGHFQGVCNVVHRLLLQTKAQHLFMGAKDYQQCMVVKALIALEKLQVQLHVCPTLREANGLAMSSRNLRLSPEAKATAGIIHQCLLRINNHQSADFSAIKKDCEADLVQAGFTLEYIILAHATTLQVLENYDAQQPMVVLFAAWLEGVRLIDNMVI
jgi:pantoate--beta-alanine ligase